MDLLKALAIAAFVALCAVATIARAPAGYASEGIPPACGEAARAGQAILTVLVELSGDAAGPPPAGCGDAP